IGGEEWKEVCANRPGSKDGTVTCGLELDVLLNQRTDTVKDLPAAELCPYLPTIELLDKLPEICRMEALGERHKHPGAAFDGILLRAECHHLVIHVLDRLSGGGEIHYLLFLRPGAVPEAHERHPVFDIKRRVEHDVRGHRRRVARGTRSALARCA